MLGDSAPNDGGWTLAERVWRSLRRTCDD